MTHQSIPSRARVGICMDLLRDGLRPFVESNLKSRYGDRWQVNLRLDYDFTDGFEDASSIEPDVYVLLKAILRNWDSVFSTPLGKWGRTLIAELQIWRNRWAHQCAFSDEDADRMIESAARLLKLVGTPDEQVRALRRPATTANKRTTSLHPGVGSRPGGQRAFMQNLVANLGFDKELVTRAYAEAEERGEIHRQNRSQKPLSYARALWSDEINKGWLRGRE